MGISNIGNSFCFFGDASFYGWRIKYGQGAGSEARDNRKLRDLQEENTRLKSMLADALLKLEQLRNRTGRAGNGKERSQVWFVPALPAAAAT